MSKPMAQVGRLCLSKSGRDSGRLFIIKEVIDDTYVWIVDGGLRKVDTPKKKKVKHLEMRSAVIETLGEKFAAGAKVFDAEVRSALRDAE